LWVHQDDVHVVCLESGYALANRVLIALHVIAPKYGITAGLPNDELRVVGQHITREARYHLLGIFAADTLVHHCDGKAGPTAS
jgi:hypothetical protein